MNTTVEQGYTVIYDTSDGGIGFIGIDDHSGGYPYFSSTVERRNVFKEIGKAFSLKRSLAKMKSYYGSDKVHFGTVRVVKMAQVFSEIDEDEDKIYLEQTLKKLNDDELEVISRYLITGSKNSSQQ